MKELFLHVCAVFYFCDFILWSTKEERVEQTKRSSLWSFKTGCMKFALTVKKLAVSKNFYCFVFYALYMSLVVICSASYYIYVVNGL